MNLSDRKHLKILCDGIEENLAEFAQEHRLAITTGNIKFERDGTGCTVQLKVAAMDESGHIKDQYERDFEQYWEMFKHEGLKAEHLHAKIRHRGQLVELVGLRPGAPKFPLVVRDGRGKVFCLTLRSLTTIEGFVTPPTAFRLHRTDPPPATKHGFGNNAMVE